MSDDVNVPAAVVATLLTALLFLAVPLPLVALAWAVGLDPLLAAGVLWLGLAVVGSFPFRQEVEPMPHVQTLVAWVITCLVASAGIAALAAGGGL